jgi:hypothetical protein
MTKNLTFLFFLFLINPLIAIAQKDTLLIEKPKSSIQDIEKIYLHTDKSLYITGETLWYKSYLVYAYTNVLFDNSNILYVELISPESIIVARNITKLVKGQGQGDIKLMDSIGIKTGTYQLRAYTNSMRNYGDTYIFKKEIKILAPDTKAAGETKHNDLLASKSKDTKNNTITPDENIKTLNIQFFPEGGSLIENVQSYVAFKATDQNGNPKEIKGEFFDANGKIITTLKSSHDGMGKFMITPEKDQLYSAKITDTEGHQISTTIQKAEKTGYVLSVNIIKDKKIVTVKTNPETLEQKKTNRPLHLLCSTRGITYYQGTPSLSDTQISFPLPDTDFPEGITQITLLDEDSKPQSERLLYIEKNNDIDISLTPDKSQYLPREKVNLKISAKNKKNEPLFASFSIASTDVNLSDTNNDMNICSYFLMSSDIRGKIHNPGYYFDPSNSDRLANLDLLLLTQGWRNFIWKNLSITKENTNYQLEKGIRISGKVKKLFSSTTKENNEVKMILMKNGNSIIMNDTTDETGNFEFDNIFFTGNATILLDVQNEKGKNKGMFVLDSIYNQPCPVNYEANILVPSEKNKIKENVYIRNLLNNIQKENRLTEVVVTNEKKNPKTGRPSKYGFSDRAYFIDEKTPKFTSIYDLILYSIPSITLSYDPSTQKENLQFNRFRNQGPALILLDGVTVEQGDLSFVNPEDVAEIDAHFTAGATAFLEASNGIILVYTKTGEVHAKKIKVFHTITKKIKGFNNERIFYSPDYNDPKFVANDNIDTRNTLYWNPYVHLDDNGTDEISYYNNDISTEVKVTLEGITSTGIPVVVKTNYSIKKQSSQ